MLWKWMMTLDPNENSILCGDCNMVELWDDAVGHGTLIHEAEAWAWNKLVHLLNLVDNYLCTGTTRGRSTFHPPGTEIK